MIGLKLNHVSKRGPWWQWVKITLITVLMFACDLIGAFLVLLYILYVSCMFLRAICDYTLRRDHKKASNGSLAQFLCKYIHNGCFVHNCTIIKSCSWHYSDVITTTMVSQITSVSMVYSTVYSGVDQRKYQSSTSLALVRGIHWWPVNSQHKWPVMRKKFPSDDVFMIMQKLELINSNNIMRKKVSKLNATGLCEGNSPVTGEFSTRRTSKEENASIWWRHH